MRRASERGHADAAVVDTADDVVLRRRDPTSHRDDGRRHRPFARTPIARPRGPMRSDATPLDPLASGRFRRDRAWSAPERRRRRATRNRASRSALLSDAPDDREIVRRQHEDARASSRQHRLRAAAANSAVRKRFVGAACRVRDGRARPGRRARSGGRCEAAPRRGAARMRRTAARSRAQVGQHREQPADRLASRSRPCPLARSTTSCSGSCTARQGRISDQRPPLVVLQHEVPAVPDLVVEEPRAARAAAVQDAAPRAASTDAVAGDPHPVREVAVVLAHEIALVEQPDGDRRRCRSSSRPLPDATPTSAGAGPRSASGRFSHGLIASQMKCSAPPAY